MKRSIVCVVLVFLLLAIPSVFADGSWSIQLVAGQHTTIGTVDFIIVGNTLTANFNVTVSGWCLGTTHLYVGNVPPDRAAPGQFPYQHEGLGCVTHDSYSVPTPSGDVFVAAHAESHYSPDNVDTPEPIGDTGTMLLDSGSGSYMNATINIDGLGSNYPAWCVDLEHLIQLGTEYTVAVTETGTDLVDIPDNLDLVLYVINQDYSYLGATVIDIQTAIWLLIDNKSPSVVTSTAQTIVSDASANGEGFTPGCGQVTGVFMNAGDTLQKIMVVVPAPCSAEGRARSETAWALASWGHEFRQGWGMYLQLVAASTTDPAPDDSSNGEQPPADEQPPSDEQPPADDGSPVVDQPDNEHGNRARREEAPGQNPDNSAPGDRSNESRGNNNNNGNNGNSNGNSNGNGHGRNGN